MATKTATKKNNRSNRKAQGDAANAEPKVDLTNPCYSFAWGFNVRMPLLATSKQKQSVLDALGDAHLDEFKEAFETALQTVFGPDATFSFVDLYDKKVYVTKPDGTVTRPGNGEKSKSAAEILAEANKKPETPQAAEEADEASIDVSELPKLKVGELRAIAAENGIEGMEKAKKADVLKALQELVS